MIRNTAYDTVAIKSCEVALESQTRARGANLSWSLKAFIVAVMQTGEREENESTLADKAT